MVTIMVTMVTPMAMVILLAITIPIIIIIDQEPLQMLTPMGDQVIIMGKGNGLPLLYLKTQNHHTRHSPILTRKMFHLTQRVLALPSSMPPIWMRYLLLLVKVVPNL